MGEMGDEGVVTLEKGPKGFQVSESIDPNIPFKEQLLLIEFRLPKRLSYLKRGFAPGRGCREQIKTFSSLTETAAEIFKLKTNSNNEILFFQ